MNALTITARRDATQRDVSWIFAERVCHKKDEERFETVCILTSPSHAEAIYDMLTRVTLRDCEVMENCYRISPEKACAAIKEVVASMRLGDDDFQIETFPLGK